jgi:arginine-tRNA-protein transferase
MADDVECDDRAPRMRLRYVHLGYCDDDSRKMGYKHRFLPHEQLMPDGWLRVET